jgi:hypothetical protein
MQQATKDLSSFIQNIINTTIDSSQNIYGQHLFCLTLNKQSFDIIISKNAYGIKFSNLVNNLFK